MTSDRPSVPRVRRWAGAAADTAVIAGRDLRLFVRTPEVMVFAVVQPMLVVVMFRYVFAGAIQVPSGDSYVDYLLPGIFAQTVLFGAVGTGVGLAEDLHSGAIDRFRTLPMAVSAVLAGRAVAELARTGVILVVMLGVIAAVGFRPRSGSVAIVGALLVLLCYAFALSWVFSLVGLLASNAEGAEAVGFPLLVPFAFASSAFVPVETMPNWLEAFAAHQPVTATVDATRALLLGEPAAAAVTTSLAWSTILVVVVAPLVVWRFRRPA